MVETERRCNECGQIKPIDQFEPAKRYRGGRMPRCRTCRAAYRQQLWKRERRPVGDTKRCSRCDLSKDLSAFTRDKRTTDGYTHHCADCRRVTRANRLSGDRRTAKDRFMRWKYGVTLDEFEQIVAEQGGVCAACGNGQKEGARSAALDMDHCHKTGRNRGALCTSCNTALGLLNEDLIRIQKLASYLQEWQEAGGCY